MCLFILFLNLSHAVNFTLRCFKWVKCLLKRDFNKGAFLWKETPTQASSCDYCEILKTRNGCYWILYATLWKKRHQHRCFPCFYNFFKNILFTDYLWDTVFVPCENLRVNGISKMFTSTWIVYSDVNAYTRR